MKRLLPAGKYLADGNVVFLSDDPEQRRVECIFMISGGSTPSGGQLHSPRSGNIGGGKFTTTLTLPLDEGFIINSPKDVELLCQADVSGTVFAQSASISIIRVDTLQFDGLIEFD